MWAMLGRNCSIVATRVPSMRCMWYASYWRRTFGRSTASANCAVAGVEVEQRDAQWGGLDRGLDLVERLAGGPPELDGVEAGGGGALEALHERRVLEQDRDVGAEPH